MSQSLDGLIASLNSTDTSAALLALISDSVSIGVVTMKQNGEDRDEIKPWTIVWSTNKFDRDFGYLAGELQRQPLETIIPDRYREVHITHTDGFSDAPQVKVMGQTGDELYGKCRDGSDKPIQLALTPAMYNIGDRKLRVAVVALVGSRPGTGGGRCPVAHG